MPKTRSQKEVTVQILSEKLQKAKSVVMADYKGLTMKDLSDLRNKLIPLNAEFTITKNSLLQLALKGKGQQTVDLQGPTATLFAFDDEISPLKILVKAFKDSGIGRVKLGFLGSGALDEAKIMQLSTLPSKDELRGKTVGVLVAPLQGIVSVLQANLRNLVYAISEIQIRQMAEKGGV